MTLTSGRRVRFLADSRNGDWHKGQLGVIEKVIALHPMNQTSLYVVRTDDELHRNQVLIWASEKDIEPYDQLTIFDELVVHALPAIDEASGDNS